MDLFSASLRRARGDETIIDRRAPELYLETLGITDAERDALVEVYRRRPSRVDPVVGALVGATNGIMCDHLIGRLDRYPIPEFPLRGGGVLLDIGCSWGRWSIAAARAGFAVVGVDPSLGAIMAARRVAEELGVQATFVVGDARNLPFADGVFDRVYSYSVIQHLSRRDVDLVARAVARVLRDKGEALIQMPNRAGARSFYHQARRRFRPAQGFEVRYWGLGELRRLFEALVGPTRLEAEGYFGLGMSGLDRTSLPVARRAVHRASVALVRASTVLPSLIRVADSVFVRSRRAQR